jgi:hypothetical protein
MTNNKKQTVVDRIVNLLNKEGFAPVLTQEEIKSFKEMEKERTIEFCIDWYFNGTVMMKKIDVKSTIDKHFNETYGGGEQ